MEQYKTYKHCQCFHLVTTKYVTSFFVNTTTEL